MSANPIAKLEETLPPSLRSRLVEMRAALIDGLTAEPVLCGGRLALLGSVGAALAAIDAADK